MRSRTSAAALSASFSSRKSHADLALLGTADGGDHIHRIDPAIESSRGLVTWDSITSAEGPGVAHAHRDHGLVDLGVFTPPSGGETHGLPARPAGTGRWRTPVNGWRFQQVAWRASGNVRNAELRKTGRRASGVQAAWWRSADSGTGWRPAKGQDAGAAAVRRTDTGWDAAEDAVAGGSAPAAERPAEAGPVPPRAPLCRRVAGAAAPPLPPHHRRKMPFHHLHKPWVRAPSRRGAPQPPGCPLPGQPPLNT